jgi:hypothetical protein
MCYISCVGKAEVFVYLIYSKIYAWCGGDAYFFLLNLDFALEIIEAALVIALWAFGPEVKPAIKIKSDIARRVSIESLYSLSCKKDDTILK